MWAALIIITLIFVAIHYTLNTGGSTDPQNTVIRDKPLTLL